MSEKTYVQIQREYREFLKSSDDAGAGSIRVSLQSDFTIDPFAAYLWAAAKDEGLRINVSCGPYDQFTQEFLYPSSALYSNKPDITFLLFGPNAADRVTAISASLSSIIDSYANNSGGSLVVSNIIKPSYPFHLTPSEAEQAVVVANAEIAESAAGKTGVRILDMEELASFFGKEKIMDHKLHYMGKIDFSHDYMTLLARKCMTYIRRLVSPPRKVLALDLDNTLWGGIIGEDGIDGISLSDNGAGQEFYDFQKEIKYLQHRGIILAICSKNNPEDALNAINNHPSMLLRESDFSAMKINWKNKDENIREMAAELNLGVDSFVFLDDSPMERGLVSASLPEVAVPELPKDPVLYASFLRRLDLFESFSTTDEDVNRIRMYSEQKNRDASKNSFSSVDDYIKNLNIKLNISPVTEKTFSRACQLIMKTNQFNLTTRRHNETAMKSFLESADYEMFTLAVRDSFGDSGVTGLAILKHENKTVVIDTFLLSCRILGRRIEETFISELAKKAATRAAVLIGEYVPTKKNMQVADFYERMGFSKTSSVDNMDTYEMDLTKNLPSRCALHEIETENLTDE